MDCKDNQWEMKERQWSEELIVHEVENVRPLVSGGERRDISLQRLETVSLATPYMINGWTKKGKSHAIK